MSGAGAGGHAGAQPGTHRGARGTAGGTGLTHGREQRGLKELRMCERRGLRFLFIPNVKEIM